MRIIAFGTYQADSHPRVRVLIEGLREHGHEIIEVNEPLGLNTAQRVSMLHRPWTVPALGLRMAARWWALYRRGARMHREVAIDAVLVGYMGHFDVHLARRVFRGIPIILDQMIFAAGTAVDRGAKSAMVAGLLERVDRRALAAADLIVLDAEDRIAMVPAEVRDRVVICHVGADRRWFAAGERAATDPGPEDVLRVVFYGLYTPLQGTEVIGHALALLAARTDVEVTMIGNGQDLNAAKVAAGDDAPVAWTNWVSADELPVVVASHHVALGIFGTTAKGLSVVPHKVYQSAAAGCGIVTSDTPPQRRVLGDHAVLVPPGDPAALADVIRTLAEDPGRTARLRAAACGLAAREFTAVAVTERLNDAVLSLIGPSGVNRDG